MRCIPGHIHCCIFKVISIFKVTILGFTKYMIDLVDMKMSSEIYKGIEFVRISSLEAAEKNLIKQTLNRDKIIKILRNDELLNDCIQYNHYLAWREQQANNIQLVGQLN